MRESDHPNNQDSTGEAEVVKDLRAARLRIQRDVADWRGELRERVSEIDTRLDEAGVGGDSAIATLPPLEAEDIQWTDLKTSDRPPPTPPAPDLPKPPQSPARTAVAGVAELPPAKRLRVPTARSQHTPAATRRRETAPLAVAISAGTLLSLVAAAAYIWLAVSDAGFDARTYSAASLVVWWAVALALVLRIWPRQGLPRATALGGVLLAAFSLFALLSTIWASDGGRAFAEAARAVGYLGVFVLGAIVVRSGGGRDLLGGLAIGLVGLAALALLSRFQPGLVGSEAELQAVLPESAGRLSYPIDYWNGLAAAMALAICLLAWLGADARGRLARSLAIAALPLGVVAIYLTGSRGGTVAAGAGLAALVALAPQRWRTLGAILLGSLGGAALVLLASGETDLVRGLDTGAARAGGDRLTIAAIATALILGLIAWRADGFLERFEPRRIGVPAPLAAAVIVIAVLVANAAIEPGEQLQESRSNPEAVAGIETLNGEGIPVSTASGRIEYWESAVDAFRSDPVTGLGAGEFETWWRQHGALSQRVRNAHSLFFETLAELGIVGAALIIGFFAVAAIEGLRRGLATRRDEPGGNEAGVLGAALAMLIAGAVSAAGEWTWELPATFVPVVLAAALLTTPPASETAGERRTPGGAFRLSFMLVLCAGAILASGLVYLAELRLSQSHSAAAAEDYEEASDRARAASDLQPWDAEPYAQLALLAREEGDDQRALDDLSQAIERSPEDWRLWLLRAQLDYSLGDYEAERADLAKARELAPRAPATLFVSPGPRTPIAPPVDPAQE